MPYSFKIWGIYAPACCPRDIEGQIADKFGETVTIGPEWGLARSPLHHAEEEAPIRMGAKRVGTAYRWGVA